MTRRHRRRAAYAVLAAVAALLTVVTLTQAAPATQDSTEREDQAVVSTDRGRLRGLTTARYRQFTAIPYAAAPVGELRWRAPRPARPWRGVRDATEPAPRCAQRESARAPASTTEDCLYLNVVTPRTAGTRKPVMVWLHGGGFLEGSGGDFDARRLAVTGDVVVVTVNYRLGVFGLFAHPGLAGSGGFALADQQAALRWVRRNAAAFGGDPGNVTLFGESAGGKSVCAHLASPASAGLFHRAITQSAPCTGTVPAGTMFPGVPAFSQWPSVARQRAAGERVAAQLGCPGGTPAALACLRRLPPKRLLAQHDQFMAPAHGNAALPRDPERLLDAGRLRRVPVLSGTTRDEMRLIVATAYELPGQPISADDYAELLDTAFGARASEVARRYPVTAYASPGLAWATLTTDRVFACPTHDRNRRLARRMPVYAYEWGEPDPATDIPGLSFPLGAAHAAELSYLFPPEDPRPPFSADQWRLSDTVIRHWARFARTGDPNGPGLPRWPRFSATSPTPYTHALVAPPRDIGPVDLAREHHCGFWEDLEPAGAR